MVLKITRHCKVLVFNQLQDVLELDMVELVRFDESLSSDDIFSQFQSTTTSALPDVMNADGEYSPKRNPKV